MGAREALCRARADWEQHHPLPGNLCGAGRTWVSISLLLPVLTLLPLNWVTSATQGRLTQTSANFAKGFVSACHGALAAAHLITLQKQGAREGCKVSQPNQTPLPRGVPHSWGAETLFYPHILPPHSPCFPAMCTERVNNNKKAEKTLI